MIIIGQSLTTDCEAEGSIFHPQTLRIDATFCGPVAAERRVDDERLRVDDERRGSLGTTTTYYTTTNGIISCCVKK